MALPSRVGASCGSAVAAAAAAAASCARSTSPGSRARCRGSVFVQELVAGLIGAVT